MSLLVLACDPNNDDGGGDEPCKPPEAGVAATYSVSLVGFPEVEGNALISTDGLQFSGNCMLDAMDFDGGELTLTLSCEHPAPSVPEGASVTITTAAEGLPANVEVGDTLTFEASVVHFEHIGGDASGPIFRGLEEAGYENYQLNDGAGPVFAAVVDGLGGNFEPIMVTRQYDCPGWEPCSGENPGPIAAYVRASVGGTEVDVHVGEVALLDGGDLAWDLSLFSASLDNGCHDGESGGFSIVRRPQ